MYRKQKQVKCKSTFIPSDVAQAFNMSWSTETIATRQEFKLSPAKK